MASRIVLSRRAFLKGIGISGAMVSVGLPPLDGMFNSSGTAYAAAVANPSIGAVSAEPRFLLWFNGNGIAEKTGMMPTACQAVMSGYHSRSG